MAAVNRNLYMTGIDERQKPSYRHYQSGEQVEPEGKISMEAARKLLDHPVNPGYEFGVRAFETDSWPEETYDISVEVVDLRNLKASEETLQNYLNGNIVLKDAPNDFEAGLYDFAVTRMRSEYLSLDSGLEEIDLGEIL